MLKENIVHKNVSAGEEIADWEVAHRAGASKRSLNAWIIFVNLWATMGGMTYGYTTNIIGSSLAQPSMAAYFQFANTSELPGKLGGTASLYNTGAFFGFWACGYVADRFGRKKAFMWTAGWNILGMILTGGSAGNWGMLLVARLIAGFGGFPCAMIALIYASEISIAETRGFLAGAVGFQIAVAYAVASWVGVGFSFLNAPDAWRGPLLLGILWPVLVLAGLPFVPESPRWLSARGRHDEALVVLKKMHKNKSDPHDTYALIDAEQIRQQAELEKNLPHTWSHIASRASLRRRALLVAIAVTAMQASGILAITNFGPILYSGLGYGTTDQLLFSAGWITLAPIGSFIWMFYVDKVGRKPLLVLCPAFCAITLIIYAVLVKTFANSTAPNSDAGKAAAVAMTFIFMCGYIVVEAHTKPYDPELCSLGLSVPIFVFITEIWPTHLRAKGVHIALACLTVNAIWVTAASPTGFANLGYKYTFVFVAIELVMAVLCWYFLIETKNVPLEEINRLFGDTDEVAVTQAQLSEKRYQLEGKSDNRV